jgi:hypothetical protein
MKEYRVCKQLEERVYQTGHIVSETNSSWIRALYRLPDICLHLVGDGDGCGSIVLLQHFAVLDSCLAVLHDGSKLGHFDSIAIESLNFSKIGARERRVIE